MRDSADVPMSLRDHMRVLQRRRWTLLAVLAVCAGGAIAYALLARPSYQARAELVVASDSGPRSAVLSAAAPVLSMLGEPVSALGGADLATQVQIVDSRPTLESAWGLMHERPEVLARLLSVGLSDELLEELPAIVEGLGDQPPPDRWPEDWQALLDTLMVGPLEDAEIIEVCCESPDAERARDFVNALVLGYLGRSLGDARATTRHARSYVDEQLADVEARLSEAEESLRQFGERVGTVALDETARQQVGLLVRLNEQAAVAESTLRARRALHDELDAKLAAMDERVTDATVVRRNPEIVALQEELAQAEAARMSLLEEYAPEAMPVRRATAGVEELRARLRATAVEVVDTRQETLNPVAQQLTQEMVVAEGEELAARESMRVLQAAASRVEGALAGLPDEQVALLKLQREIELLERFYLALKEKQQEYDIAERSKTPASRLLAHAIVSEKPARPKKLLTIAAGLMAGVLLGLLAAGLAEQLDDRLRDPEQAAVALGLPVLGVLAGGADVGESEALSAILQHLRALSRETDGPAAFVLTSPDDAGEAEAVARDLARLARSGGEQAVVLTQAGVDAGDGGSEEGLRALLAPRTDGVAAGRALEASHADLLLAVPPAGSGLLAAAPLLARGGRVMLVVNVRQATLADAKGVVSLAREHGAEPVGLIATGARASSARYIAAPART